MSDIHESLLESGMNKKRIIGVLMVAMILFSLFAFSTYLFSVLLGSQRTVPNEELDGAEQQDAELVMPPIPFDLEDLKDLFDDLSPEEQQELAEMLQEMYDGDIDNLDLGAMALGMIALLASNETVFNIYNYDSVSSLSDNLWKYECFDQFDGDGWTSTVSKSTYGGFPYDDYTADYSSLDLLKISMPLTPGDGLNSMVVPNLFPSPNIMEDSFNADNLQDESTVLYKDPLNCTTVDTYFSGLSDGQEVDLTYELFGFDLPTNIEINNSAVDESYTPTSIQNQFLQLPPDKTTYINDHPFFASHYNTLDGIIQTDDNAFMVANKIRNYLQDNFTLSAEEYLTNGPDDGEDEVEWFCETQSGIWTHFASAFAVFCRAFDVASRFVDGFNNRNVSEEQDGDGINIVPIKYKNLYNWAEVFVPTSTGGDGYWVQMDVMYETFGGGGQPLVEGDFSIDLILSNFSAGFRGVYANLTALLTSPTESVENRKIQFYDFAEDTSLGEVYTDVNGQATLIVPIDNSKVIGPHPTTASFQSAVDGDTYTVWGDVQVILQTVDPVVVNRTQTNFTEVSGQVWDPNYGGPVRNATVNYLLFEKATSNLVPGAFTPQTTNTDDSGFFLANLRVNDLVNDGEYEIRVDFNGTWNGVPLVPAPMGFVDDSSGTEDLNVTSTQNNKIHFYIQGFPDDDYSNPVVNRYDSILLEAYLYDKDDLPIFGEVVEFYDVTLNRTINTDTTDATGYAAVNYNFGHFNRTAGPNLLVADYKGARNHSYYIVNEKPTVNILSGPTPNEINRTGGGATQFTITGYVNDSTNYQPIPHARVTLQMLKDGVDNSTYLLPQQAVPFTTDKNGYFALTFDVDDATPPGAYDLRVNFTGSIDYRNRYPQKPFEFVGLNYLVNSTNCSSKLRIYAPDLFLFDFKIDGIRREQYELPVIPQDQTVNFSVYIEKGGVPIPDGEVITFYDMTNDTFLGSRFTTGGYAELLYYFDGANTMAGPHLINATWKSYTNYSYFVYDKPVVLNLDPAPIPREINRSSSIGRDFTIHGYLADLSYMNLKFGEISVHLFDGLTDVSGYLIQSGGSLQLSDTGEIDVTFRVQDYTPQQNYTVEVWFNGTFLYSSPNNEYFQYDFYLTSIANFSVAAPLTYELKVLDPYDVNIYLSINGSASQSSYNDFNPPEWAFRGDYFNFTVLVTQSGAPVVSDEVRIYDVYDNYNLLDSYTYSGFENGYYEFIIPTSSWFGGLHLISVNWSIYPSETTTYVVINESVNIDRSSSDLSIIRNSESFTVSGYVTESSENLRALRVSLKMFNSSYQDVTSYINFGGLSIVTTNEFGYYQFFISSISLDCPQGQYYFRVDFNGSISWTNIFLSDYMIHNSSELLQVNINANTTIIPDTYYTRDGRTEQWRNNDILYVLGNLTWDNGTAMANMVLNVTVVKISDGSIVAFNDTVYTDEYGGFNASLTVDLSWPDYQYETDIYVDFIPGDNSLTYVESSTSKYT